MNVNILSAILLLIIEVKAYEMRMAVPFNQRPVINNALSAQNLALQQYYMAIMQRKCMPNNGLSGCTSSPVDFIKSNLKNKYNMTVQTTKDQFNTPTEEAVRNKPEILLSRSMFNTNNNFNQIASPLRGKLDGIVSKERPGLISNVLNMKMGTIPTKHSKDLVQEPDKEISTTRVPEDCDPVVEKFEASLEKFEGEFFATTFNKLALLAPPSRLENGMSYVQSTMFLQLSLMALATEVAPETRREIEEGLGVQFSDQQAIELIESTLSSLPESGEDLKFRWSSRLVLRSHSVSDRFRSGVAKALRLQIDQFNATESPKEMANALNHMVEVDSGGAIHDTFEESELTDDISAVFLTTLYLRARWRSAPTLLNGSRAFRDSEGAPRRAARMIRLNDVMMYADLPEWDAEALEIPYSRGGLSLLLLVPRGPSLRRLVAAVRGGLGALPGRLAARRVAATLPLYTLRMTLLLPNKLRALNISRLVEPGGGAADLRLSLAVQRVMFWAEAGRNAFKDDGVEWDEPPQTEVMVDRPYIFYVRWKNKTIMNGNFVL